jgi:pimeloyl-ACP methyl ester carboxylesterase
MSDGVYRFRYLRTEILMLTRRTMTAATVMTIAGAGTAMAQTTSAEIKVPWTAQGDVKVAAGKMHWASVGSGEPLVLLPKLGGWIADWRHVAAILAQQYRVIVIDNPGHGGSTLVGPAPYWLSLPESAAMLMATLDELGIGRCTLGGNSLGGCIATVSAALWPEKFSKLILLSVALGGVRTRAELEEGDKLSARNYDAEGRPLPRPFAEVAKSFGITDPAINDEQNQSRAKAGVWVRPSERGVGHAGITDYLPRITASTLLMYGALGGYKQFEAVGLAAIPKVKSVHIPNASSFAHQDQPQTTARLMLEFLAA